MGKGKKTDVPTSTRQDGMGKDGCPAGTVRYEGRCVDPNWILFNKGQQEIDRKSKDELRW